MELSRQGLQIVLATHDYVFLKWFDLLVNEKKGDEIRFHALYRQNGQIKVEHAENYNGISENAISDTYSNLTKAQVKRNMGDLGK